MVRSFEELIEVLGCDSDARRAESQLATLLRGFTSCCLRLRDDIEGPPNIKKKSLLFLCTYACTGFTKSLVALRVLRFD